MKRQLLLLIAVSVMLILAPQFSAAFEWQSTWDNTWGYSSMPPEDRKWHEQQVRNFKTVADCEAYIKDHNRLIQQRIDDQNFRPTRPVPPDLCWDLKNQGLIQ
ncbi:MAG: hypothetical protein ACREYE_11210 [Gammaproteobacteria bacterium]